MNKTVTCKDVFGNEYEQNIEDLDVRIGVYAVIIRDNKILLARQWGGYSIIGGGVEKGETLEEAYIREIKEETGLDTRPGRLIHHAVTFFQRDKKSQAVQSYQFYFASNVSSGAIHTENITPSEATYTNGNPEWIDIDKIDQINFRHSIDLKTILDAYNDDKSTARRAR